MGKFMRILNVGVAYVCDCSPVVEAPAASRVLYYYRTTGSGHEMSNLVRILVLVFAIGIMIGQTAQAQDETSASCTVGESCESGIFGVPAEVITSYPSPNVKQVYADDSLVFDRRYRRVIAATEFYEAPGAGAKDALGPGFNFVTINTEEPGWTRTANGLWLKSETLSSEVNTSRFAGMHLPAEELPFPVGWLLVHVRPSTFPGNDANPNYPVMLRYTTVNIYDQVMVDGWYWFQIGLDQWVKQTQIAMVQPIARPSEVDTERWISVDLYEQVLIAYEGTQPVYATLVSSGLQDWPTNEGLFHVYVRYPRTVMAGAYGQPDFYYLQEVPWTMYFDNDIALHGAYWHDGFGYRRSHGCVNLSITDAKFLYDWSSAEFDYSVPEDTGPAVFVYSSGTYR